MAKNEVFRYGDRLLLDVPEGVESGDPVLLGELRGVAQTDRDDNGQATVWLTGVHSFELDNAINAYEPVYILANRSLVTETEDIEAKIFGYAIETTTAAGPVAIRIAKV